MLYGLGPGNLCLSTELRARIESSALLRTDRALYAFSTRSSIAQNIGWLEWRRL
jgi:hypothetical protein